MKNRSIYAILLAAALLLHGGPLHALPAGLSLTLHAENSGALLPNIPVILEVTIANTSAAPVDIPEPVFSRRDQPYNTVDILAGPSEDKLVRVGHLVPNMAPWREGLPPEPPGTISIAAGSVIVLTVPLSYDWRPDKESLLVQAGTLHVQARLCDIVAGPGGGREIDRENALMSNRLALKIDSPTGIDKAALARVNESERPWLLAHPAAVEHLSQDADFRRFQVIADMNAGEYSRHAAALVAYMFAQGNALDLHSGRPPQPQVARQWLDKAMSGKNVAAIPPDWKRLAEKLDTSGKNP